jgi:hypothetical protein
MPVVCTLFEGLYHSGVAILANSLWRSGYRGVLYVGYRGELPHWAIRQGAADAENQSAFIFKLADGLIINFIKLDTRYHFTNYKPDFMLSLINGPASNANGVIYVDPDITILAPWKFLSDWIIYGIAVCEDINSPISMNHPRRQAWRQYFSQHGFNLSQKTAEYANGGFVGASRDNIEFLQLWKELQTAMGLAIGGLERSIFNGNKMQQEFLSPYFFLGKTDQDALNAAIEASTRPVSFLPRSAMGFENGLRSLPHALGSEKPWKKNYFFQSILGKPPSSADKAYWMNADGPIRPHGKFIPKFKRLLIRTLSFFGRFYRQP